MVAASPQKKPCRHPAEQTASWKRPGKGVRPGVSPTDSTMVLIADRSSRNDASLVDGDRGTPPPALPETPFIQNGMHAVL